MSSKMYKSKLRCESKCDGQCTVYKNKFICQGSIMTYQQNECDNTCGQACSVQTFSGKQLIMPVYVCPSKITDQNSCQCDVPCDAIGQNKYVCFAQQHKEICEAKCGVECQVQQGQYMCPEKGSIKAQEECNAKCSKKCIFTPEEGFTCPAGKSNIGIFVLIMLLILLVIITVLIVTACYRKKQAVDAKKSGNEKDIDADCYTQTFHKYNHTPGFMDNPELRKQQKTAEDIVVPARISVDTVPTSVQEQKETKQKITVQKIKTQPAFPSVIVPIDKLSPEMKEIVPKHLMMPDERVFVVTGVRFD